MKADVISRLDGRLTLLNGSSGSDGMNGGGTHG